MFFTMDDSSGSTGSIDDVLTIRMSGFDVQGNDIHNSRRDFDEVSIMLARGISVELIIPEILDTHLAEMPFRRRSLG